MPDTDTDTAPAIDPSVLAGGANGMGGGMPMPALGTPAGPAPVLGAQPPSMGTDAQLQAPANAAAPQQIQQGDGSAGNPIVMPPQNAQNSGGAVQAPQPAGVQSVWKNMAMGAIAGLAGSAGTTHFGGGLAAGAGGALQQHQQVIQNQNTQQKLQYESVQAADSHINALDEHQRADNLNAAAKQDYKKNSAEYQAFLQDNFGIEPNLDFNDSATDAQAAQQTLASQNGGTIPPVAAVHQPEDKGAHGSVAAYSPSTQQMKTNSNGFRQLINTSRQVQGLPDIDDPTFNSMGFKGQRDAAQAAITAMKPTPAYNLDKNSPSYLPVVLAQRQQQLDQYSQHKDANGKPDANPNVEKTLQNGIDYLQSSWKSTNDSENKAQADNIAATAAPKAAAEITMAAAKMENPDELAKPGAQQAIQSLLADSRTSPQDANRLRTLLPKAAVAQQQAVNLKTREATALQAVQQGTPEAAGALLANRTLTLDELKLRQATPAFIAGAVTAAQKIDPGFKAPEAAAQAKIAAAPANQQFFGNTDSLLIKGGTLDQLAGAATSLPNDFRIPALNKAADWTSAATGAGSTARFAASVLGVADDYAKVMGGTQGSDTSRQQVFDLFKQGMSKTQIDAGMDQVRQQVRSQRQGRVGQNPYLKDMYPEPQNYDAPKTSQLSPAAQALLDKHGIK